MFEGFLNIEKINGLSGTRNGSSVPLYSGSDIYRDVPSDLSFSRSATLEYINKILDVYYNAINNSLSEPQALQLAREKMNEIERERIANTTFDYSGEYNYGKYVSGQGEVEKGYIVRDSNGKLTTYESKTAYETAIKNVQNNNNITATNPQQDTSQNADIMQYANYFAYGFVGIMIIGILKKLMTRKKSKK